MNKYQQLKFAEFFDEIAETQIHIQNLKTYFLHSDLSKLFHYMLKTQKQFTIRKIIQILGSQITSLQAYCIIHKMDRSGYNKISKQDFCLALFPKQFIKSSKSKINNIQSSYLKVIEIFKAIIEQQKLLDMCRIELSNIRAYEAFDSIDKYRLGYLTRKDIYNFMEANQISLSPAQINALINFFTKDDRYFKINLEAFCQALMLSKTKYQQFYKMQQAKQQQVKWLLNCNKQQTQLKYQAEKRRKKQFQKRKEERRKKLKENKSQQLEAIESNYISNQIRQKRKEELIQEKLIRSGSSCQNYILEQLQHEIQTHKCKIAQLTQINNLEYDKNYLLNRSLENDKQQLEQCKQRAKWSQSLLDHEINNIEDIETQRLYREGLQLKYLRQQMLSRQRKTDTFQEKPKQKYVDQQDRRKRKLQLQEELEKTRIAIQIRKKKDDIENSVKREFQKLKSLRSRD